MNFDTGNSASLLTNLQGFFQSWTKYEGWEKSGQVCPKMRRQHRLILEDYVGMNALRELNFYADLMTFTLSTNGPLMELKSPKVLGPQGLIDILVFK